MKSVKPVIQRVLSGKCLNHLIWNLLKRFHDKCLKIELPFEYYKFDDTEDKTPAICSLGSLVGKNDAAGAFFLGLQLVFSSSPKEALPWLEKASDLGVSDASYVLSMVYSFGSKIGVVKKRNNAKLVFYIQRAIEQNPENS